MNKRFSWIVLAVSGAFFVFIVGLTGYRIEEARRHNTATSHESAAALAARVHSLADTTGSVQSPFFANAMRDVFSGEPRLLLVSVHSPQDGILYLLTRNRSFLKEPATITPEWKGTPAYRVAGGSEILVSASVGSDMPSVTMDALYVIMGREDLYAVVRDDLYFFLAFLLVVGVAVLIVMSVEEEEAGRGGASTPGRAHPAPPAPAQTFPGSGRETPPREPRAFTSPRTGLVWAEYLEPRLKAELERAASSDGEISLAQVRIDEPFADTRLPMAHAGIARLLKQTFPLHDLLFEAGDNGYTVVLPDADVDTAVRLLDDLRTKVAAAQIEGRTRTLSAGVSSRAGRLIDSRLLREEAQVALAKAEREGGNQVVGFRADAARFREKLAVSTG
jgi:hypothetical protein